MATGYYNIDAILAEEELVPCTTNFDFSYLSHLDPDQVNDNASKNKKQPQHFLPESSKIKIPLWAVAKWAELGFCKLALPRHYNRKARELLEADAKSVNLRKRNERFYLSAKALIDLMERSAHKNAKNLAMRGSSGGRSNAAQLQQLENVLQQAKKLRETILQTFTGERLCQTLDWALSSVGDDVTAYLRKLTVLEQRLYRAGAVASANHATWKLYGNRRLMAANTNATKTGSSSKQRTVSPMDDDDQNDHDDDEADNGEQSSGRDVKRQRTY